MADLDHTDHDLEERLVALLKGLNGSFSPKEVGEVESFLAAGEYGLALETLTAILVEERKEINQAVMDDIDRIAGSMNLTNDEFVHDLHAVYAGCRERPLGLR